MALSIFNIDIKSELLNFSKIVADYLKIIIGIRGILKFILDKNVSFNSRKKKRTSEEMRFNKYF